MAMNMVQNIVQADMTPTPHVGPCGCLTNGAGNFLQMCCCLPCHYGKAMEKAQICGGCLPNCCSFLCGCGICFACNNRGQVRAKYGIQGNAVMDCVEVCCCPCIFCEPCRTIQEIQIREKDTFGCI